MAIYHFSAQIVICANGSSAAASAVSCSASKLHDDQLGRDHYFPTRPEASIRAVAERCAQRLVDRTTLWSEVAAKEKRKDAQLVGWPSSRDRVSGPASGGELARELVEDQFVAYGMVADLWRRIGSLLDAPTNAPSTPETRAMLQSEQDRR